MQLDEADGEVRGRRPRAASHGRGEVRFRQPRAEVPADLLQYRVRQPEVHAAGNRHHLRAAAARPADTGRAAQSRAAHGGIAGPCRHRIAARRAREPSRRCARRAAAARSRPARFALGAVVRGIAGDRERHRDADRADPPRHRTARPQAGDLAARVAALEAEVAPSCAPSSRAQAGDAAHEPAGRGCRAPDCWWSPTSS